MSKFSPELKERLIRYFAQKYEIKITAEQAEEYLNSFAELLLALSMDKPG